ncbi:spore germination protein KB [Weizmannia acidilactici]|uniref:Spore germination protein KB n=1 Tax=Weizmannia acidilactici TaxID=2607726 RepID=A0A5J4J6L5_9BACI|nr:GerAB/ArcD/ProY family transporter [Weizmannia acidilactici]GER68225.1 spore germination protein KB [Weizmannia acidilactici]GER70572.1 spore germination protein KB [Weizmannia acidilactici]GER73141.1 spore germination protein KB [Weizmannia acidilactici]
MEKAKISPYQLFVMIFMFELGSALLLAIGSGAKQDAWLAILGGMCMGFFLFYLYYKIFTFYPDLSPVQSLQAVYGKFLGWIFGFNFGIYFLYLSARVLRDFGEMLIITSYPEFPLFIINAIMAFCIIYAVKKGIEVIARTGEIFFIFYYIMAITGFVLIIVSRLINLNHLKPVLESGVMPVLKSMITETIYVPFGETIVFFSILPLVNHSKKVKIAGLSAILLSGTNLVFSMLINISVIGAETIQRSPFPLLSTIREIQFAHFLERLDVFFMIALIVGGFFKVTLFFYAACVIFTELFKVDGYQKTVYPLGFIMLCASLMIASTYAEHINEGLKVVPILFHFPAQVAFPLLSLLIILWKERRKKKKQQKASPA